MTRLASHILLVRRRVVVLLLFFASALMTGGSALPENNSARIDRISFSPAGETEYHLRLHSDREIPWYGIAPLEAADGLRLTLLNARLAENAVLDTAEGPVESYTAYEENGKVVVDAIFSVSDLKTTVHQDPDSYDIILVITGRFDRPLSDILFRLAQSATARSDTTATIASKPEVTDSRNDSSRIQEETHGITNIPNRIPVVDPVALPRRSDIANVDAPSTEDSTGNSHASTEPVISDMDRMFAAALSRSTSAEQKTIGAENGQTNTASSQWTLDTVVIDAGHGGWDEGAFGLGGTLEKDLALDLAKKLGKLLTENLSVKVVYTRTDDRFISLAERGRFANQAGGKLFLSIHANSSKYRSARGTETFFLGMHRSDSAKVVMERENEVVKLESDGDQYQKLTQASLAQQALAQSSFMRHSEMLAEAIQRQFREGAIRRDRGVKQAGFYVLFGASMPAVLIELGFLTNPYEEKFLASDAGQTTMANAIFRAVESFKLEYEKTLQIASQ